MLAFVTRICSALPPLAAVIPCVVIGCAGSGHAVAGETGAVGDHWAFERFTRPAIPTVTDAAWVKTPIDALIRSAQEARGLQPNREAARRTLIRRVCFDLTGLPPSPAEVDAFVNDPSPFAYESLVDRQLESSRYGERWGRHWLDQARYADSMGYRYDDNMPFAFAYRDFVIRAFNDDLPFNTFVQWQIAGDELASGNSAALAATGFCAVGPRERIEGTAKTKLETRYNELDDIVSTTGSALLGLTIGCARCHDHKFDPIKQSEYYSLMKAFMPGERRELRLLEPGDAQRLREWEEQRGDAARPLAEWARQHEVELQPLVVKRRAPIQKQINAIVEEFRQIVAPGDAAKDMNLVEMFREQGADVLGEQKFKKHGQLTRELDQVENNLLTDPEALKAILLPEEAEVLAGLQSKLAAIESAEPALERKAQVFVDKTPSPVKAYLLKRGDFESPGDELPLGFLDAVSTPSYTPEIQPAAGVRSTFQRAALARWLTDTDRGAGLLLARVMMNRLWYFHFGEGLVRTPGDFGTQGDRPALPALLDWLSCEFIARGWSIKQMHKLILMSAVYRQDTGFDAARETLDPENRLWWRRRPLRLESEILRDTILAVSGKLNPQMYGPGDYLPVPPEMVISALGKPYPQDIKDDAGIWRRGIYAFVKRTVPVPMLQVFDGADPSASCAQRVPTTVAPQALLMMNDPFIRARSADFAEQVRKDAGSDVSGQIERAWLIALGRAPDASEKSKALDFLAAQTLRRDGDRNAALADFCQIIFTLNEFIYVD